MTKAIMKIHIEGLIKELNQLSRRVSELERKTYRIPTKPITKIVEEEIYLKDPQCQITLIGYGRNLQRIYTQKVLKRTEIGIAFQYEEEIYFQKTRAYKEKLHKIEEKELETGYKYLKVISMSTQYNDVKYYLIGKYEPKEESK